MRIIAWLRSAADNTSALHRRLLMTSLILLAVVLVLTMNSLVHRTRSKSTTNCRRVDNDLSPLHLAFNPTHRDGLIDCVQLFNHTDVAVVEFSSVYKVLVDRFKAAVDSASAGEFVEGHSSQVPEQYLALHYIAQKPFFRHVCETGFNLGHSSFNFLAANPDAHVYSFDIGKHGYASKMAAFLNATFPGRLTVTFGDSTVTVAEFVNASRANGLACDLMFVDGGHSYAVALADLWNFASIAEVDGPNLIVFDDYPTLYSVFIVSFVNE